jgi:hypothetical protein
MPDLLDVLQEQQNLKGPLDAATTRHVVIVVAVCRKPNWLASSYMRRTVSSCRLQAQHIPSYHCIICHLIGYLPSDNWHLASTDLLVDTSFDAAPLACVGTPAASPGSPAPSSPVALPLAGFSESRGRDSAHRKCSWTHGSDGTVGAALCSRKVAQLTALC